MKRIVTTFAAILMTAIVYAQAPNKMSYQAVIRNSSNALVTNQSIGMQISILQGSINGSSVYIEKQTPTTNNNGLASIEIGSGIVISGIFSEINWANGPYYCKIDTDPNGGVDYSITSTSQLLSVPYSLFSGNGIIGISITGDSLFLGNGTSIIIPGISEANNASGQTGITLHTCGATNIHNPTKTYGSMTDQEGNVYKTIVVGSQEWMAENLKTSIFRNGNEISNLIDASQWYGVTTGAYVSYFNDSLYECPYGKLYNWHAVADLRNLCPIGWHTPTDTEWATLVSYLGGEGIAGGKMKSAETQYWVNPIASSTNESGFSGLPGGYRFYDNGAFDRAGFNGYWWSNSQASQSNGWAIDLPFDNSAAIRSNHSKQNGFSVRCVRD